MNIDIGRALRDALLATLARLPQVQGDGAAGRDALLLGIPLPYFERDRSNAQTDLMLIVGLLEHAFGPGGEWYLLRLVENAGLGVRGTGVARELLAIHRQLEQALDAARRARLQPADVAQVHLFDLAPPANVSVLRLMESAPGTLHGFVLTTASPKLLGYFCERLKRRAVEMEVWARGAVAPVMPPLTIHPLYLGVAAAVHKASNHRAVLERKNVIFPVCVPEPADAAELWLGLQARLAQPFGQRLVVVLGTVAEATPAGMTRLPKPQVNSTHVTEWVRGIVAAASWPAEIVERWAAVIMTRSGPEPVVESLYEEIEAQSTLVLQNRSQAEFLQALEDLESIGG
jgi:hypothetical protein